MRDAKVARVFITGSSDGLGLMAARVLIEQGHEVDCRHLTGRVEHLDTAPQFAV
jgi:NAD(P)-dependent dehydrogenase (short-subunit alcohol dehydrogenase family)